VSTSSLSITIPNLGTFPLSTLESLASLVPVVTKGIGAGKSAEEIKADLEAAAPQALLGFAESVLNVLVPGGGTVLEAVAWLVENNKNSQMTQAEQNAWMDRFGIGTQS
jgi:hypothetical protein